MELRCDNKLHGVINGDVLEVQCRSALCGKRAGVVVMHFFNLRTGQVSTKLFKDPGYIIRRERSHALGRSTSVRNA